ncbi:MAG TPA: WXG100 family type VII secretion target [Streptosporangiaceae bacterium]|nr:WXG100 family type VII secretion target [Streptosporangiaceae bacterium]
MGPVKVTSEELASASVQLSMGSREIHSQLAAMRNTVQSLAGCEWQGADSSSFGSLCQQWNTAAAHLREALDGISTLFANGADACAGSAAEWDSTVPGTRCESPRRWAGRG